MSLAASLARYTFVLTTFGTLAMEAPIKDKQAVTKTKRSGAASGPAAAGTGAAGVPGGPASRASSLGPMQEIEEEEPAVRAVIKTDLKLEIKAEAGAAGLPGIKAEVKPEVKAEQPWSVVGTTSAAAAAPPRPASASGLPASSSTTSLTLGGGPASGRGRPANGSATTTTGGLLFQVKWHRVVLDEAQSIKNPRTLAARAAWRLAATHRWCLSGTPIQNSVGGVGTGLC